MSNRFKYDDLAEWWLFKSFQQQSYMGQFHFWIIFMVPASLVGHGLNFLAQDFSIELGQIASCAGHSARIFGASYALQVSHYTVTVWQGMWCISRVATSTLANPSFANIRSISTILSKTPTNIGKDSSVQPSAVYNVQPFNSTVSRRVVVLAQGSTNKVHHNLGQTGKKRVLHVEVQHLQVRWNHKNYIISILKDHTHS